LDKAFNNIITQADRGEHEKKAKIKVLKENLFQQFMSNFEAQTHKICKKTNEKRG